MSQTLLLVGIAGVALLAALGAFAIAWRRSTGAPSWREAISAETRRADKSPPPPEVEEPVLVEPAGEPIEIEAEGEEEPVGTAVTVTHEQRVVEVSPEEAGVSRRQFFNRALSATFGSFLAILGIELLAFMWPKLKGGFGASIDAGVPADLATATRTPDGGVIPAFIPEARAYVVPVNEANLGGQFEGKGVAAGGLMALYQRCVHLGCRVPWCATSQGFECPCHGSKYDFIGEYFGGPAPRNLDRFQVEIIDDRFIIHTGSIIQTPRAPSRTVPYPQGPSCIAVVAPPA
ncbi:MAG TPA: ubiquinol-cytochrome c reductase iron-sulfur subunit [Acidimicrobiia bacterium]|nr:ubiquinol-cytochrome c reductase iron-sulfur subunit [Acidimicrobiia bacterium]